MTDIQDEELIEEAELDEDLLPAVVSAPQEGQITLFGTNEPNEIIGKATAIADALSAVIKSKKLYTAISGRQHVRLEGWTLCGTMLGVFGTVVWSREVEDGWEARAEARTLSGALVGSAEAQCTRSEGTWSKRDAFALRSMAQTRALSKALRMPLGFIITLAGYDTTPAEEMTAQVKVEEAQEAVADLHVSKQTLKEMTAAIKLAGAYDPEWTGPNVKARCVSMGWLSSKGQSAASLTEAQAKEIIAGAEDTVRTASLKTHPEGEPAEVVDLETGEIKEEPHGDN